MMEEKVHFDWLTRTTGDPFVDCGGYVIKYLRKRKPDKTIFNLIKYITDIYVNKWDSSINALFLNSKITQPAYTGDKKITETLDYFSSLLNEKMEHKTGYCRILGEKSSLFYAGRDNFILSGSGTFVNFHHFMEEGLFVSKEVLIRMYFIPLGITYLGDKVALIQSNNNMITEYFVYNNCEKNFDHISSHSGKGILKSEFHNPINALFEFANDCIRKSKIVLSDEESPIINLYHFTNFGANANIVFYTFPAALFQFYKICVSGDFKKDWGKFVNSHYYNSKYKEAVFDKDKNIFELLKKKTMEEINFSTYKKWYNTIYQRLLENKTILPQILRYSKENKFNFTIVKLYQRIINNMETKTLNKIEELADFIIQDEDRLKRNLAGLNGAKKGYELRSFLLGLIKRNYEEGNKKPLITLNEYVEFLFPDGTYWADIRDLLLISIYQKLHEKNIQVEIPEEELKTEE